MQPNVLLLPPDEPPSSEYVDLKFILIGEVNSADKVNALFTDQQLEQLQTKVLSLVLARTPHTVRTHNQLASFPGLEVPNEMILHERLARYLVQACLFVIGVNAAFGLFGDGISGLALLTGIGYQLALCICLLGYFGAFVKIQRYRGKHLRPGGFFAPILDFAVAHTDMLLAGSALCLVLSMGARFAAVVK